MKKYLLCVIALIAMPGFAANTNYVQSNSKYTCSGTGEVTVTCNITFNYGTTNGNLIAVWTFWQWTSTYGAFYTATVADTSNNFVSAVGPTVQLATTNPTSAQMFYASNIKAANSETITVTFTAPAPPPPNLPPSVTSGGIVIVEYTGLDTVAPFDSGSAAVSNSPGSALDSGNVVAASSNLMIFAAGVSDGTAGLSAGSGFTSIQSACSSSLGSVMAEENSNAVTGNNVLQRATAGFGTTCSGGTGSGNWLMQMANFRPDAWEPIGIFTAGTFSVSDPGIFTSTFTDNLSVKINGAVCGGTSGITTSTDMNAVDACVVTPPGTTTLNSVGFGAYMQADNDSSNRKNGNNVGFYTVGVNNSNGSAVWGLNTVVSDCVPANCPSGIKNDNIIGYEDDWGSQSGNQPLYAAGYDSFYSGYSTVMPSTAQNFHYMQLSCSFPAYSCPNVGLWIAPESVAVGTAAIISDNSNGTNSSATPIELCGADSTGTKNCTNLSADGGGNLIVANADPFDTSANVSHYVAGGPTTPATSPPACNSSLEGSTWIIKNSSTATWGAVIATGSQYSLHVLGYCDGTNWTVAAR